MPDVVCAKCGAEYSKAPAQCSNGKCTGKAFKNKVVVKPGTGPLELDPHQKVHGSMKGKSSFDKAVVKNVPALLQAACNYAMGDLKIARPAATKVAYVVFKTVKSDTDSKLVMSGKCNEHGSKPTAYFVMQIDNVNYHGYPICAEKCLPNYATYNDGVMGEIAIPK